MTPGQQSVANPICWQCPALDATMLRGIPLSTAPVASSNTNTKVLRAAGYRECLRRWDRGTQRRQQYSSLEVPTDRSSGPQPRAFCRRHRPLAGRETKNRSPNRARFDRRGGLRRPTYKAWKKGGVPPVFAKARELAHNVCGSLPRQSRRGRVTLSRCAVTPGAIADSEAFRGAHRRPNGGAHNRQDHHVKFD